jgi:hypothetical protein
MAFSRLSSLLDGSTWDRLSTGALRFGAQGDHYDPTQPRVPAGHSDGGQWTRENYGADAPSETFDVSQIRSTPDISAVLSDVTPDNSWKPGAQYAAGGVESNIQHQKGVEAAKKKYLEQKYSVVMESPIAVDIPGFATPRYYDFIVQDPVSGHFIGVEVKTTIGDTIRLNPSQVAKDVAVVQSGGVARVLGVTVKGVGYITYCAGCDVLGIRSWALSSALKAAKVPFTHGGKPGETRP